MTDIAHHPDTTGHDDPDPFATVYVGIVGTILLIFCILALQAAYYNLDAAEAQRKIFSQPPVELMELRAGQQHNLTTYGWVDRDKGIVRIPIDRAIELTVQELASGAAPSAAPKAPNHK